MAPSSWAALENQARRQPADVASVSNRFIAGWTGGRDGGGDDVAIRELEGANLGDHKQ